MFNRLKKLFKGKGKNRKTAKTHKSNENGDNTAELTRGTQENISASGWVGEETSDGIFEEARESVFPLSEKEKESLSAIAKEANESLSPIPEEVKTPPTQNPFSAIYELSAKYPKENVARDITSSAFKVFCEKKGDISHVDEVYTEFLSLQKAFLSDFSGETVKAKEKAAISSDNITHSDLPEKPFVQQINSYDSEERFSTFSGTRAVHDYSSSLSPRQMEIAKGAGLSYREYSELLNSIPKGKSARAKL